MRNATKVIGILVLLLSFGVQADNYIGVGVGRGSADVGSIPGVSNSIDDTSTVFKVFGGVPLSSTLDIEFGYADFGDVSLSATNGVNTVGGSFQSDGFFVSAVGNVPLTNSITGYGKVGLALISVDASVTLNGSPYASGSDTSTDLMFGVGAEYKLTKELSLRGEFERYLGVGGSTTGKSDIDVLGVSAVYHF